MPSLELLQFTDTHLFGDAAGSLRGIATYQTLRTVLAHARVAIARADAILVTGDLVQDDPRGYALFRDAFAALGKPVWCLPGNHDVRSEMQRELRAAPFEYCGVFDRGAWRIIMLDSCTDHVASGHLAAAELRRLKRELEAAQSQRVLICLHHQPVPMRSRWLDSVGLVNAEEFLTVIDQHEAQVGGIVWGHVHQALDSERRGVRLLATPSTCTQFRPLADEFSLDDKPPAYRRLMLHADGRIDTELLWVN